MKPIIDKTRFGTIRIAGKDYQHDVIIRLDGQVRKRKKKLSKQIYGTSHVISLAEAEHIYQEGADRLIIGGGTFGRVKTSPEAAAFFAQKGVQVEISPTAKAAKRWNQAQGKVIGLFHITC